MSFYQSADDMTSCDYNEVIKSSMEGADFSQVDGVEKVHYTGSAGSCDGAAAIIGAPVAVVGEEGLSAGAMIGIAALAAALAALALLAARRRRRKDTMIPLDDDFSLVSTNTDNEGRFLGAMGNDPFASTVDVHKCASMYCNCNKGLSDTTFIPVPQDGINKKQLGALTSPQGVDEAQDFFPEEPQDDDNEIEEAQDNNIMRVPPASLYRSLTPVNEVPHDSEIDTEIDSEGEEDTVPPPPPPPLPSNYDSRQLPLTDSDEMSI